MSLRECSNRTKMRVARRGADALHEQGKAHTFTSDKARSAANARWARKRLFDEVLKTLIGDSDRSESSEEVG
jgi:hypothetical protein